MAVVNGSLELGYKNLAWFNANPTLVLKEGQIVYLEQTGTYKIGNGTSTLSALSFLGVSSALGFTPYNATNPDGFISGITSGMVTTALGFTPYNSTNPSGYITGITSGMVTTALGFTPYDATNPSGYITSSALTGLVPYTGATANVDLGTFKLVSPLHESTSNLSLNATGSVLIKSYNAQLAAFATNSFTFTPILVTSGLTPTFTFTKPNNTNQTASASIAGWNFVGGSRQWATGNITAQNENIWGAVTYSFVGASTITNAYGNVFNAPVAGTNCTITNNWAAQFNGNVQVFSTTSAGSSIYTTSGSLQVRMQSFTGGQNWLFSTGGRFLVGTSDSQPLEFFTNFIKRFSISAIGIVDFFTGSNYADSTNIAFGTTTGSKIGSTTTQKLAFWNATPIVQPTTSVTASTFVANTSMILNDSATFDGYTIGQVVKALRNMGLLA